METNGLWLEKINEDEYLVGFKEETIEEIEELSYLELTGTNISSNIPFLEVESKKATFEYVLPFDIHIVEDYTEQILKEKKLESKQPIAKINIIK